MESEQSEKLSPVGLFVGIVLLVALVGSAAFFLFSPTGQPVAPEVEKHLATLASKEQFNDAAEIAQPIAEKFEDEVQTLIDQEESFIEVDLSKMELYMYKAGKLEKKVPVLSKGREGSWWETPTGNYKVMTKEENHFSSIGKVWMPWSMQFYGNFFIHGWPYHQDGTEVSSSYSGGCIRLSTSDAEQVFAFAERNMPVLVRESEEAKDFAEPTFNTRLAPPKISAQVYLVFDVANGKELLAKNEREVRPIASLTKLMTGIVASELVYLGKPIEVRQGMLASTLASFEPEAGQEYVAFDLLYPLLMQSSDEAANILAGFIGRNHFVNNMNLKASSLSMKDTSFADASGEEANTSSAADLKKLLKYIYFKRKFILNITRGQQDYRFEGRKLDNLKNYNEKLETDMLVGLKNGETTDPKQTMAGIWEFETAEGKTPIGIVVLGSKDSTQDTQALLDWTKQVIQ